MNRPTHPQLARTLAGLTILVTLTVGFGIPGALAAILTVAVLATLPAIYAFAVGQLAVAIFATTLLTPSVLGAELGLLLALWSDLTTVDDRTILPLTIITTALLAILASASIGETESLWVTGGILLSSIVLLVYAIHRYTVVFTLEEAAP